MKATSCKVHSLLPLTEHVYQVLLKPEQAVSFEAGQYLNFVMSDDDKRPFSIASAPKDELIELQIGAFGADSWAMQVIDHIKANDVVTVEVAAGVAQLKTNSERPIILLAGGTGFSYIKSILADLVERKFDKPVLVYWGLREPSACYQLDQTQALVDSLTKGQFTPVVETADEQWQGSVGKVHEPLLNDVTCLADYDIYMAGRFDMVGFLQTKFIEHGGIKEHMYGDAFAFI
ncbi:NAD(P)H-flavin reductase [Thalassomonas sp. M1454]|uniref:NAD(P)H-flavin reductase n=1 Tax=Thalassomonas sp. M1454 TaxID=2594477 RepID=UPI00117E0817|nr:NAD(P)H-flavin reductase [Thalassomonas sp. M1454]TRX55078.1 NAD(P)H-flavin reductase [Thalassomonas sp. M1454]